MSTSFLEEIISTAANVANFLYITYNCNNNNNKKTILEEKKKIKSMLLTKIIIYIYKKNLNINRLQPVKLLSIFACNHTDKATKTTTTKRKDVGQPTNY